MTGDLKPKISQQHPPEIWEGLKMMVVWIKCFECRHFACEQTGRFDCVAFLPKKGVPAEVYAKPIDRV